MSSSPKTSSRGTISRLLRALALALRPMPFVLVFAFLAMLATLSGAGAQSVLPGTQLPTKPNTAPTTPAGDLDAIVSGARERGATVLIIPPEQVAPLTAAESMTASTEDMALRLRSAAKSVVVNASRFVQNIGTTLAAASDDGTLGWLLRAAGVFAAAFAAGWLASRMLSNWAQNYFRYIYRPDPALRSEKIYYLLFRAVLAFLQVVVFLIAAGVIVLAFDDGHEPTRKTIVIAIASFAMFRLLRYVIFWNFLAPDAPNHRMINLPDPQAGQMYRDWNIVFALSIAMLGVCLWMDALGLDRDTHKLVLIGASLIVAVMMGFLAIRQKEEITGIFLGAGDRETKPLWRRVIGMFWQPAAILYLVVAWAMMTARLLLDLPTALGLVVAPGMVFIFATIAYWIALLMIDALYARRANSASQGGLVASVPDTLLDSPPHAYEARSPGSQGAASPETGTGTAPEQYHSAQAVGAEQSRPLFKGLLEHGAAILIAVCSIALGLAMWDINLSAPDNPIGRLLDVAIVAFLAYLAYQAVRIWIDARIEDEGPVVAAEPGEEGAGGSASRLATLLPMFRNFLLATISVIAGMIMLSELGVDIAPLFAGAGVIGLAVGFGAQALIRDIFSGAFFLIDDAFRRGEYIDIGSAKGTVEKISIRSFQLRHHNGPLHTIPFGEIKQLTNFSRDWVVMKLPLRLTYDTDAEKVRKMIKKLGVKLLEHPEIGDKFLQPLKSQGVIQMEDSAMIMRIKFMTKPGDQWSVRKTVFAEIRDLFEREGIRFASREVTVRLADDQYGGELTSAQKTNIAAAGASRVIEQPNAATAKPGDDR